jgi:hypothetical protein
MRISEVRKHPLNVLIAASLCVLLAGCAGESGSGMLMQPGGTIDAEIYGDSTTLEIENEGRGSVTVVVIEGSLETVREELNPGQTLTRDLTRGGRAMIVNDSSENTMVRVKGRGGTGFKMSGKNPSDGR